MHSHGLALAAVLWLPILCVGSRRLLMAFARRGRRTPARLLAGYEALNLRTRVVLFLMLVDATVHLALIPEHAPDVITALLFAVDFVVLTVLILVAVVGFDGWRPMAYFVLTGEVAAYVFYVTSGREALDFTGIATKAVELTAMAMLATEWSRSRHQWAAYSGSR